jgi:orotate phosphoribosyltransferase-like protein
MDDLTQQIAELRAEGLTTEQIAERLGVSVSRVGGSDLTGYDETDAESFPASDPPPGPER